MKHFDYLSAAQIFMEAFSSCLQPLCKETGLNQTSIGILNYIARKPNQNSAKDVCKDSTLKPNLVSFHVDKLVTQGYLERQAAEGDRRTVRLVITEKAKPVVEKAAAIEQQFMNEIAEDFDDETREILCRALTMSVEKAKQIKERNK